MPSYTMNEEEFQKYLNELKNSKGLIWRHNAQLVSGSFSGPIDWEVEEKYIPLEQDENGVYGYKTLIRFPDSPWFWSPNRFHKSEWVDNRLTAHESPLGGNCSGIYATKSLEELREWYEGYKSEFRMGYAFSLMTTYLLKVKIRAWGVVVEHSLGFRAEHAEIVEVYDGHR